MHLTDQESDLINLEGCSSISQALNLFSRDHQFESHKTQGHYKFIWSLTLGSIGLVEIRVS
jgi:hypothetical protein